MMFSLCSQKIHIESLELSGFLLGRPRVLWAYAILIPVLNDVQHTQQNFVTMAWVPNRGNIDLIQRPVIFRHQANGVLDSACLPYLIEYPNRSAQRCGIFFFLTVVCWSRNCIKLRPVLCQVKDFRNFLGDVRHLLCQFLQGCECCCNTAFQADSIKIHSHPKTGTTLRESTADFLGTVIIYPLYQFFTLARYGMAFLFASLTVGFRSFLFLFSHGSLLTSLFRICIYYTILRKDTQ